MRFLLAVLIGLFFFFPFVGKADENGDSDPMSSSTFEGLKFRSIGPAITSGRITDFAVNSKNPAEYYVSVASGNVWKTVNGGTTFEPVFDEYGSYSIGCVTMDPNNHNVVWVGTGENNSQRSVSYGDGIYKTEDGGKSWENMGLKTSEHISKIIVDPRDSDVVYVASQGPLWGPGGDRGLFKTTDGGETWETVLTISENTGVTDVVMDPRDPDLLYAASYQRRRHVFTLINGGPESAIYKSTDAGHNWKKLESGIPKVYLGRIGLAISPANPDVVYAIIEAADDKGGIFRSTDRGASWEKRSDYVARSPQYYQEIVADPQNVDVLYALDTYTHFSEDGGKTMELLGRERRHVDDHALWIDPENTNHLLIGGDGGIYESYDRGENWDFKDNLPITQFYRVAVDNDSPFYNIYGGTQDNFSLGGPSQTTSRVGIVNSDWYVTKGGDGFESAIDPRNPKLVYSQSQYGWLVRYDRKSHQQIGIKPQIDKNEEPLRWNWDSPLIISPHSNTRLYFAANKVFRSDDRGNSWTAISPDLTRQLDRNQLPVMGRLWSVDTPSKNASTSLYGTIVSLTESPLEEGLIYAGTDDGLIRVTENGGETWRKIENFPGIPERTYVCFLKTSQHDVNTVYAAFDNHKRADFKPYILKSTDRGKSWTSLAGNLPENGPVYAVLEDHVKPDLLFAGTEFGVFFTVDGGQKWIQLKGGVPTISVKDLDIQKRENDLVLGTFGRSFYVLDDYSPLRYISTDLLQKEAHVFPVDDALMYIQSRTGTGHEGSTYYIGKNPPFGATFTYYLKESIKTLKEKRREKEEKLREEGKPIPQPSWEELRKEDEEEDPFLLFTILDEKGKVVRRLKASAKKGIYRISWDLRYPDKAPVELKGKKEEDSEDDSYLLALPGPYQVKLSKSVNGKLTEIAGPQEFEAKVLGVSTLPAEDRDALVQFQNKVGELRRAVLGAVKTANEVQDKIKHLKKAFKQTPDASIELLNQANAIDGQITEILRVLEGDKTISKRHGNQPPSVTDRISTIVWGLWRSTSAPTQTQHDSYQAAAEMFKPELSKLRELIEVDLKNLENEMEGAGAPWTPGRIPQWRGK